MNSPHQAAARLDGGETLSKSSHRVGRARELTFAATARDSTAHGNAGIENDSSQPAPSAQLANVVKPSGCARGVDGLCASIGSSSSGTMAASRLAPGSAPMTETCRVFPERVGASFCALCGAVGCQQTSERSWGGDPARVRSGLRMTSIAGSGKFATARVDAGSTFPWRPSCA